MSDSFSWVFLARLHFLVVFPFLLYNWVSAALSLAIARLTGRASVLVPATARNDRPSSDGEPDRTAAIAG